MSTPSPLPDTLSSISVRKGEPEYESHRRAASWNQRVPDRFPEVIVYARDVGDVQNAVRYARDHDLTVTALSSGHNYLSPSLRDETVLIDVSALNSVQIDIDARRAVVGPGTKGADLARLLAEHGLAFPVGHCSGPAMGGYLLNGGVGLNASHWGIACFLVPGLELVDSAGDVRQVDEGSDPDLLWLARGAGPSFPGVITSYTLDLKELPTIAASVYVFTDENLPAVTAWLDERIAAARSSVEFNTIYAGGPLIAGMLDIVPQAPGYIVVHLTAFEENAQQAQAALAPFREGPQGCEPVFATEAMPQQIHELFAVPDASLPDGHRISSDTAWTDEGVEETFARLKGHVASSPSGRNHILSYAGARWEAPEANFSMLRRTGVTFYGVSQSEDDDEANAEWVAQGMDLVAPITVGHWVGEADLSVDPSRARKSFAPENWARARGLRKRFDPDGRFADYLLTEDETG